MLEESRLLIIRFKEDVEIILLKHLTERKDQIMNFQQWRKISL